MAKTITPLLNKRAWTIFFLLLIGASTYMGYKALREIQLKQKRESLKQTKQSIRDEVNTAFRVPGLEWPEKIDVHGKKYNVDYTINKNLTDFIKRILRRYKSDYSSVVVLDNNTGAVLAAVGHERETDQFNKNLAFSSTHPSASLIKIVTTADLLDNSNIDKESLFQYRGRGTTLYKYQLKEANRGRSVSLKHAFAFSNNVVFGKAAIQNSSGMSIYKTANEFGFNQKLMSIVDLSESKFKMAESQYNLAELASGFNKQTLISPVHAAVLSSVVANQGEIVYPHIVNSVSGEGKQSDFSWEIKPEKQRILREEVTRELMQLMERTVRGGTARRHFKKMRYGLKSKLRIGGKTGTITGGVPHGRRDWFTAFAFPKDNKRDKGISVSVMNINLDKWYVRSTYLSRRIIEYYYQHVRSETKKADLSKNVKAQQNRKSRNDA